MPIQTKYFLAFQDRQQESEPVEFPSADCVLEESEKEHCTMLPTQLDCRKTTVSQQIDCQADYEAVITKKFE